MTVAGVATDPDPTTTPSHPGLRVWTQPSRTLQTICLTFPRGQRDEEAGQEGLAHLIEHLAHCRGDVGSSQFFAGLSSQGAVANAYTGADYVQFWVAVPEGGVRGWVSATADQLYAPTWSRTALVREHQIIGHEVDSKVAQHPHRGFSFHHVRHALFADHANGHAGFVHNDALLDLSMGDIADAFAAYLRRETLIVTSVGPMQRDAVEAEVVGPLLGTTGAGGPQATARPYSPADPRVTQLDRHARSPYAQAVTFPVELTARHAGTAAAQHVAAALLGQGRGAALAAGAPRGASLTARVGFGGDPNEDRSPSCLTIETTVPAASDRDWLSQRVRDYLSTADVQPQQVSRARQYVLNGILVKFETALQFARTAGWLDRWAHTSVDVYIAALKQVDGDDVVAVLRSMSAHGGSVINL